MPNQVWGTTVKIETSKADPDHSLTFKDLAAWVIVIPTEAALDFNTRTDAITSEAAHDDLTQLTKHKATDLAMTHYTGCIAGLPNINALQVINPEIIVDYIHAPHTDL